MTTIITDIPIYSRTVPNALIESHPKGVKLVSKKKGRAAERERFSSSRQPALLN